MNTKDPVWDDDDSGLPDKGFRRREPQPPAESVPEPATEHGTDTEPVAGSETIDAPEPAELAVTPTDTSADSSESEGLSSAEATIPPPPGERLRVEPVTSIRTPSPGGGRRDRDRGDRSSAALVIIALLLFIISVISVSVYFFSRPAQEGAETAISEQSAPASDAGAGQDEEPSSEGVSARDDGDVVDSVNAAQEQASQLPPPPAPASMGSGSSSRTSPDAVAASKGAAKTPQRSSDVARSDVAVADRVPPPGTQKPRPRQPSVDAPKSQSAPRPTPRQPENPSVQASEAPLKTTKSSSPNGAQWVVQVHASPSIDDADEWLQQLQSRNIADGRIEPVTQKGAVWYRVRFGRYATRQEAEQAALELGYRNAWVDRIR